MWFDHGGLDRDRRRHGDEDARTDDVTDALSDVCPRQGGGTITGAAGPGSHPGQSRENRGRFAIVDADVQAFGAIRGIGSMLLGENGSRVITEIRPDPLAKPDDHEDENRG